MTYSESDFQAHLAAARQAKILPVDTEGTLTHPFSETWGVSMYAGGISEYYPFNHQIGLNLSESWLRQLQDLILNHPKLVFHNAKHDIKALRNLGINLTRDNYFYDTMLIANMVNENFFSKELDSLAKALCGRSKEKSPAMEAIIKALGWSYIPSELMRHYGAVDAEITGLVLASLWEDFVNEGISGEYWDIEQEFLWLVLEMEDRGVVVNQSLAEQELERGLGIMRDLERSLGFNPGSPAQVGKFLLEELGLPEFHKRTKKNKPTFNKEAMEYYDTLLNARNDKRAQEILAYRGWQKTTSSNYTPYLELLHRDGRIRPNFKIHGTKTGRMSCEKPNLQQIPRSSPKDWNGKLKQTFIQEKGFKSWEFDFAQLEFRLAAAYGQEQKLLEIFSDHSRDIFSEMAATLGMDRQDLKTTVYLTQYGGGPQKLADSMGIFFTAASRIIKDFYTEYRGLDAISKRSNAIAKARGWIKYWTGRRRHFPHGIDAHKAWNSNIQGGSFEVVKRNSVAVHRAGLINNECQLNLQVHDSLRFDIEEGKEHIYIPEIINVLESYPQGYDDRLKVKFKVECTEWGTKNVWNRSN